MNGSVVKDTSRVEKIVLLVDSIYAQSQYNIGRNALVVIQKILKNTAIVCVVVQHTVVQVRISRRVAQHALHARVARQ